MRFSGIGRAAKPTFIDGIRFASMAEARRYSTLKLLLQAGEISNLELQPKFPFVIHGIKCGFYKGDFKYVDKSGAVIVEDVKSSFTAKLPVYRLKKKLVQALHGVEIREVQ